MQFTIKKLFDLVTAVVFGVMLLFLTIGIIVGTGQLFFLLFDMVRAKEITMGYGDIISQVLSLFVLIELSRSLAEYFRENRLRLTFILDAAIVFVLREVMIELFEHRLVPDRTYALSTLLFVLGALRIGSVLVYQRGRTLLESNDQSDV